MTNTIPLISIILPVYNGEQFLSNAIKSILNQTYSNFELIIVNDCSTDLTFEIANHFVRIDQRIKIHNNLINQKLPKSLNIGHSIAKGKYITWTSDDNILKTNFLECLFKAIVESNADVVYSNYDMIYNDGSFKREHIAGPTEQIFFGNKIGASFLYKFEVFKTLEGYNENLYLLEDYDFWFRSCKIFKFHHLNKNLYKYRIHSESLTYKIQKDVAVRELYKVNIFKLFNYLTKDIGWNKKTMFFLISHFIEGKVDILDYLKNKQIIIQDLRKFNKENFDNKKILDGLRLNLRRNLMSNKDNYNLKLLLQILKKEPLLLFHKLFSKKVTLKYIFKSVKG